MKSNTKLRVRVPAKLYEAYKTVKALTENAEDVKASIDRKDINQLYVVIEKLMIAGNTPEAILEFLQSAVKGVQGKLQK